jgi:hypothetical protein
MQLYTVLVAILAVSPSILAGPCMLSMFYSRRILIDLHFSDLVPQGALMRRTETGDNTPCVQAEIGQTRCVAGDANHEYECINDVHANPPRLVWLKSACADDRYDYFPK